MDVKILNDNIKFKYRVAAIIIYKDMLLVEGYGDKTFCLPGGYVEVGETSEEAIVRELKEETGLNFKIKNYCGIIENFFTNFKNQKTHGIDIYYQMILEDEDLYRNIDMNRVEHDKGGIVYHHFQWISLNELDKYTILPNILGKIISSKERNFHYIIKEI